jgi:hypothetical protein
MPSPTRWACACVACRSPDRVLEALLARARRDRQRAAARTPGGPETKLHADMETLPDFRTAAPASARRGAGQRAGEHRCAARRRRHRPAAQPAARAGGIRSCWSTWARWPGWTDSRSRPTAAGARRRPHAGAAGGGDGPAGASAWRAIARSRASAAGPGHRSAATLGGNLCQDTRCVYYNQSAWWRAANDYCLKRGGAPAMSRRRARAAMRRSAATWHRC